MTTAAQSCDRPHDALLEVDEVVATIVERARRVTETERIALTAAVGRVLAEGIQSLIDVPGHDNSAMDGYILNSNDIEQAQTEGLPVTQRIAAGTVGKPILAGECARIFTGAPIPEGGDTVVIQEVTEQQADRMRITAAPQPGANIRPRGNDVRRDQIVLQQGELLLPQHLGLAASVGIADVEVYRPVRIGLLSTGDELVDPGTELSDGQIYNSNRYLLHGLCQRAGYEVVDYGCIADDYATTEHTLKKMAAEVDLMLTTGGVSVGEEDHVKNALQSLGSLTLWRVRMKPGKPLAFGEIAGTTMIGLPGNPVSSFVTFLLFAQPYLQACSGIGQPSLQRFKVTAEFNHCTKSRDEYLRARITQSASGASVATLFSRQGSDVLSSVVWADGLVHIKAGQQIKHGDTVEFMPFTGYLH